MDATPEGNGFLLRSHTERTERLRHDAGPFLLSYKIPACHACPMNDEPNWKGRAEAANYWLLSAVVAGAFVAELFRCSLSHRLIRRAMN